MIYQVIPTQRFQKESKKIVRKYPAFKKDIISLIDSLSNQPEQGNHLGAGIYKLRISISGKPTGKSYGARIIHFVITSQQKVFLLTIYDKSDKTDLTPGERKEIFNLAKEIKNLK